MKGTHGKKSAGFASEAPTRDLSASGTIAYIADHRPGDVIRLRSMAQSRGGWVYVRVITKAEYDRPEGSK